MVITSGLVGCNSPNVGLTCALHSLGFHRRKKPWCFVMQFFLGPLLTACVVLGLVAEVHVPTECISKFVIKGSRSVSVKDSHFHQPHYTAACQVHPNATNMESMGDARFGSTTWHHRKRRCTLERARSWSLRAIWRIGIEPVPFLRRLKGIKG